MYRKYTKIIHVKGILQKGRRTVMQKLKDMKIKKRLNTGFKMVTGIATIAAVLGIIAMLVASGRYEYAMTNYGFSQGDIGKAMVTFSETRSALRAVVGYDDARAQRRSGHYSNSRSRDRSALFDC